MQGKQHPSPVVGKETLKNQLDATLSPPFGLTEREKEVLKLFVDGLPYKQIARQLKISRSTVSNHLTHIYHKLEVNNRVQALWRVLAHSLV